MGPRHLIFKLQRRFGCDSLRSARIENLVRCEHYTADEIDAHERSPPCSVRILETRSPVRIIHCEVDVSSWAWSLPSCAAVRPSRCPVCAAASREPGKCLRNVGHGLRRRTLEGPGVARYAARSDGDCRPALRCLACDAILVVVPRGVVRGFRYSLSAIAWALALWPYQRLPAAAVRTRTSTATVVGHASVTRWASLRRWTRNASALFGSIPRLLGSTLRERAASLSAFVAAHAPLASGAVPQDAFHGAAFCSPG